ncbi:MAG: hypothetical protein QF801_06130 [Alphaproteobacteria bacterium]|nr:hypothetical protein [Alphaproteobacteria bacterium]
MMLWPWQTLKALLQKMQRRSEFIAFHGITLVGYTVCGFRSSSTKFTALGRTFAGRTQGIQFQLRPPLFSQLSSSAFLGRNIKSMVFKAAFQGNKGGNQHHQCPDKPQHDDTGWQPFRPPRCHLPGSFSWRANGMVGEEYLQRLSL